MITTTVIANMGRAPVLVQVSYQGYDRKVLLSPGEEWFFPVRIPRENIFFDPGTEVQVIYNPSDYQPLSIMHLTFGGLLCRKGRFLVPGFRGDGNSND